MFDQTLYQIGYVVRDMDAALDYWTRVVGAGPFFLGQFSMVEQSYRGAPSQQSFTAACGFSGPLMIELIRPDDDQPSVYKEWIQTKGEPPVAGWPHHLFFKTDDYDAAYQRFIAGGAKRAFDGIATGGGRLCYLDTIETFGLFVELMDLSPLVRTFFDAVEGAAREWDGSNPVRAFADAFSA
jgi:catechol 2,3-dioxygenase-like lactoylglutathione lyase family enzyme